MPLRAPWPLCFRTSFAHLKNAFAAGPSYGKHWEPRGGPHSLCVHGQIDHFMANVGARSPYIGVGKNLVFRVSHEFILFYFFKNFFFKILFIYS